MKTETLAAIDAHALADYPREACGFVIETNGEESYLPRENRATTPSEHFIISGPDYAEAATLGTIKYVVHSHPDATAKPSEGDLTSCESSELPWYIVSVIKDAGDAAPTIRGKEFLAPSGYEAPLVGRSFAFGVLDCFTLIRDYYSRELGIDIVPVAYSDMFWQRGENPYLNNYEAAGFVAVNGPPIKGDVIVMQVRAEQANHAGVFIGDVPGLGYDLFLHHMYGRLSRRDVYGGQWVEMTRAILRYQGLPNVQ